MSTYKLKTGKVGETVVNAAKTVEEKFTEKFLEKDENNPSGYSLKTGGMAKKATAAYQKIEDAVVGSYKKIEDSFVETFLEKVDDEETPDDNQEDE
ncbi:MAG: hypothetical protein Q4E24_09390 [bacterium]|nr:hypothetical protein [bacterium]